MSGRWTGCGYTARAAPLVLSVFLVPVARGQIEFSASLEHRRVLQCEAIRVTLRIVNNGERPVLLGEHGNAHLAFRVERRPGYPVRDGSAPVKIAPVAIHPRQAETVEVEISRSFAFGRTGPYTVWPKMEHGSRVYRAGRLSLDVVPGFEVAVLTASVVDAEGRGTRRMSLRTLSRENGERLYLRVDGARKSICYGIYDLGRYLGYAPPLIRVDAAGRIHVLHQSRPLRYTHSVHSGSGYPLDRTFYTAGDRTADLRLDEHGEIHVHGVVAYRGDVSADRPKIPSFTPFE